MPKKTEKDPDRSVNIQVIGIGFPNKGAELMLVAVDEWRRKLEFPTRLVISWDVSMRSRLHYGLWACVSPEMEAAVDQFEKSFPQLENPFLKMGVIPDKSIDVIIDASGYAYGDFWGQGRASRAAKRYSQAKALGKTVVVLPQAFGPFTEPGFKESMTDIVNHSDLVYARDPSSFKALASLVSSDRIAMAPDFTSLVKGRPFDGHELLRGRIGIIPNQKMVQSKNFTQETYVQYMRDMIKGFHRRGKKTAFILHGGKGDLRICREINAALPRKIPLVNLSDAREVKYAIGCCAGLVTSRYHGFASALYQGVPVITTSWSHKYEHLANDFGVSEMVQKEGNAAKSVELLTAKLRFPARGRLVRQLRAYAAAQNERVIKMWDEVTAMVNRHAPAK